MCWDCYDDFQEDKDPFCPKCDSELISDSEDEQTIKPKTSASQNQQKTSPTVTKSASSQSTASAASTSINTSGFNYNDLAKVRVIKKNLVYVIGLSPEIANEETLLKKEYFSQYGKITKIVVNTNNAYNPKGPNGPSFSAYLTFSSEREASMAILGTEEFQINDRVIRASYGTTKYCSFFLKQQECPNMHDCLYLHSFEKKEFFSKDDTISNKNIFIDQQKMAIKNIQKYVPDLIKIKNTPLNYTSVLPSPQKIIEKLIEQDVLDIKQKPADTPQNDQKVDKKKVEDKTPFIDQWDIDISIPASSANKKDDTKKQESPISSDTSRKQSQSMISEKDLNINTNKTSPQINKSEIERSNGQEEKINSKEEFLNKISNQSKNQQYSPKMSRSTSVTQQPTSNNAKSQQSNQVQNTTAQNSISKSSSSNIQNTVQAPALSNQNIIPQKSQSSNSEQQKRFSNSNNIDKVQKEQNQITTQEETKKEQSVDSNQKQNISTENSNQSSNVTSTNHSRTSSTNQKATNSTAAAISANNSSNNVNSSNPKFNNISNQNGNHYEKKDPSQKEEQQKYQKHQYIPVNQANKLQQQSAEVQKDTSQTKSIKEESKITKSQSANTQQSKQPQQQKEDSQIQSQQSTSCERQNYKNKNGQQQTQNNQNTSSNITQQNLQNTQENKEQIPLEQNSLLLQLQKYQSHQVDAAYSNYHHNPVYEQVPPKYKLQKVEKQEKTLCCDHEIMKKLLIRTGKKSQTSRFDFAKNSENRDQPIEEIDVIDNIFNGQYIILTKSQSTKSNYFDRSGY